MTVKNKLIVTLGDASGIGPETIVRALLQLPEKILGSCLIFGEAWILRKTTEQLFAAHPELKKKFNPVKVKSFGILKEGDFTLGELSEKCGGAAFRYFEAAVKICNNGGAAGIVSAPLNKEALQLAGHKFVGHTDILEKMMETPTVMSIFHPKIIVSHVTDHIPLREVSEAVTPERLEIVIRQSWEAAEKYLQRTPKMAVAGINPHAGENGLLGKEEIEVILPVLDKLKKEYLNIEGPLPGDTIFFEALQGHYDVVIAMYHDQGFGPMKTLDLAHSVNCTLGLPFVRTSPDHGTAFNIAGKFEADATSMIEAWKLASTLIDNTSKQDS